MAFVTGEVRPRSAIALEEIMDHLITQGTKSAAQYAENFMQRARILSHISPVVLCHHFVHGLQPILKQLCCVDREGCDWTSLHTLIAFTLVEDRRLTLCSTYTLDDGDDPRHPHLVKKARLAHVTDSLESYEGLSGLGPPSSCPCFELQHQGRSLTEWERDCLSAYDLCFYCESSTSHVARFCPSRLPP